MVNDSSAIRHHTHQRPPDEGHVSAGQSTIPTARRRDPNALDYDSYMLINVATNSVFAMGLPDGYGLSLEVVEEELRQGR